MKTKNLRISGSGTCLPLLRILGKEFHRRNPSIAIRFLPGTRSSGGIKGATIGLLDIGAVSRPLEGDEKGLGLKYCVLSQDALAIGTNPSVPLDSITSEELRGIYSGRVTNWRSLGLKPGGIVVLDRNEDESAKIIFREHVLGPAGRLPVTKEAVVLFFESDMVDALEGTPNSIGYLSGGLVVSSRRKVNLVKVDGVYPSVDNVLSGRYRIVRPLGVVLPSDPSPEATAFVKFARSDAGHDLMESEGFTPAK